MHRTNVANIEGEGRACSGGIMVDMFRLQSKVVDNCEGVERAPQALKGKAVRSDSGGMSGGTMKGKVERAAATMRGGGRRQGTLKDTKMCAGDPYSRMAHACDMEAVQIRYRDNRSQIHLVRTHQV